MYFKQHVLLLKTKYTEVEFDWFSLARAHQRLAPGFVRVRSGSLIMLALTRLQTQNQTRFCSYLSQQSWIPFLIHRCLSGS
ncbi:hypothetical protein Peur_008471 [Populus x canadensis]